MMDPQDPFVEERESTAHFNGLTPAELERLALLMEEMGEAIQAIGKIQRHGYESCHPNGGPTNRKMLEKEVGHVRAALTLMYNNGDISPEETCRHEAIKRITVKQYLHHQATP